MFTLKNITIGLSILMYFPVILAMSGISNYLKLEQNDIEALFITAYMVYFSSFFWIPYILIIWLFGNDLTKTVKYLTSLPFLAMAGMAFYISYKGMPW